MPTHKFSCIDHRNLPKDKLALLRAMQLRAHGPGVLYLTKLFIPWYVWTEDRALVLDYDLWVGDLAPLEAQFDKFSSSAWIGVAPDLMAPLLYSKLPLGANGGVQLMHLDKMRRDPLYARLLVNHTARIGYLGDQTVYSQLSKAWPLAFHSLPCRFNRQLNTHAHIDAAAYKCRGCDIVHGNQPQYKRAIVKANQGNVKPLQDAILPRLRAAFANCFTIK
jgi:hypothetical protein